MLLESKYDSFLIVLSQHFGHVDILWCLLLSPSCIVFKCQFIPSESVLCIAVVGVSFGKWKLNYVIWIILRAWPQSMGEAPALIYNTKIFFSVCKVVLFYFIFMGSWHKKIVEKMVCLLSHSMPRRIDPLTLFLSLSYH